ncbi:MAG: PD-(D/E)XK nuclease family protein, partial [Candidatus Methylopumilus sp.]
MPELQAPLILCSTARLARSLRLAHARSQRAQGMPQWQPLPTLTLAQWLGSVTEQALLQGQVNLEQAPRMVLNISQELVLWERVIERTLTGETAALFDRTGLAKAALEANRLMQEWNIAVPQQIGSYHHAEEVEQFLHWRTEFRKQCRNAGWLECTRYMDWQIT